MPQTPHVERHFTAGERVRDVVIGMSDGLTVPFALAAAYVAGGIIPLAPYVFASSAQAALSASVALTLVALLVFGYVKGRFTGARPARSAVQTALIGGVAAAAAFGIARLVG
jgi:VIT1/CCC1 family predicted Fe2+/Mn2+ transporter